MPLRHAVRAVKPWLDAWLPALSLAYATGCDFRASLARRLVFTANLKVNSAIASISSKSEFARKLI